MGDAVRLRDVLEARRNRSRAYFDRVAPHWDTVGSLFRTGVARQRVAASLVHPHLVVADVGCGTGYLSWALASLVGRLILVDHSPAMLEQAKENLRGCRASLEFRAGEIDQLPLADNEVDAVLAGMVLHHAPDLLAFVREAFRALRPGGVFVIQDLLPHREAWLRDSMADLRLGLVPGDLTALLEKAGFESPEVEVVEDSYTPERPDGGRADLSLFVVRGRRPNGAASRTLNRSMSCPS
jgi:ArsR family transcriptional regulator